MSFYICPQCGADIDLAKGNTCEYCGFTVESKNETQPSNVVESDILPPFLQSPLTQNEINTVHEVTPFINPEFQATTTEEISSSEQYSDPVYEEPDYSAAIAQPSETVQQPIEAHTEPDESEMPIVEPIYPESKNEPIISNVPQQHLEAAQEHSGIFLGHHEEVEEIIEDIPSPMNSMAIEEDIIEDYENQSGTIDTALQKSEAEQQPEILSENDNTTITEPKIEPIISEQPTIQSVEQEQNIRVCGECGFENPPMAKFCLTCGNKLIDVKKQEPIVEPDKSICPDCSFENVPNAKFCMACGASLIKKVPEPLLDAARQLETTLNEVELSVAQHEQTAVHQVVSAEVPESASTKVFKVKITFDNNNKFQYKFVYNKIKQINSEIDENELKVLMSNASFVINVFPENFPSFKQELEDLDCRIEKIGEDTIVQQLEVVASIEGAEIKYYLSIKGMSSKTPEWKMKFVNMLTLMMPEVTQEEAEEIVEKDTEKLLMENEHSAKELQKILSKLGCITQIVEVEATADSQETEEAQGDNVEDDMVSLPMTREEEEQQKMDEAMLVESSAAVPEVVEKPSEEDNEPRFLILTGVDKKNWVVREKLAERIVEIYPNMTEQIAHEIVSQIVVRLRVRNQAEAEVLGKEFEEMGWSIRIDEIAANIGEGRKKPTMSKEELQRRKQTHKSYLKRQKSKHANLVTAMVVFLVVASAFIFVWRTYWTERYYVKVADLQSLEVVQTAEGLKVRLRAIPTRKEPYIKETFKAETSIFELDNKEVLKQNNDNWYYVRLPASRSKKAYILADIVVRCDKKGVPIPADKLN